MSSASAIILAIPFLIVLFGTGICDQDEWERSNPDSLSISKDFALLFDEQLGRTDDNEISENKKLEIENNLIEVAELLHLVPPGTFPRKISLSHGHGGYTVHSKAVHSSSTSYSLKGSRPAQVKMEKKLPLPLEPSFSLSVAPTTTSKPKIFGQIGLTAKIATDTRLARRSPRSLPLSSKSDHTKTNDQPENQAQKRLSKLLNFKDKTSSDGKNLLKSRLALFADTKRHHKSREMLN